MALGFPEIVIILVLLGVFVFVIKMLIHALKNNNLSKNAKIIWAIAIIAIYPFAAIYYYFVRSSFHPQT